MKLHKHFLISCQHSKTIRPGPIMEMLLFAGNFAVICKTLIL